jgi:hypothetical protein
MRTGHRLLGALVVALASTQAAMAATIVLDSSTGADYDAVGDGWFFVGPSQPPPDGVGDAGGNDLAIGYQAGVVELRAMAEFPLAPLSGVTQVSSATVTFKIDDVLSGFGPGTTFDNTASDPIAVYHYPADGTVTVADFSPAGLAQLSIVNVGLITDASLANTGPVTFNVDATQKLKDALTGGHTAFGVLFGTADSPTGTSIDNLAPPGVPGGALPILTIQTASTAPPVLSQAALNCQATIAKEGAKLVASTLKAFGSCFGAVLKDAVDSSIGTKTTTKCGAELNPASASSKVSQARTKFASKVNTKCASLAPADIGSPCDGGATSFADTITCITNAHQAAVEDVVTDQYASACTLLSAVGLDAAYPGMCAP